MEKIILQVALDFLELDRAINVAKLAVAGGADYIEAGTPLIKSEGLDAVRKLRNLFPDKKIVADMKTMDAGKIETEAAAKAGANFITVSGTASISTLTECIESGNNYGIEIIVDLLGVSDLEGYIKVVDNLGISCLNIHCPIDAQMTGVDPLENLKKVRFLTTMKLAVAGGLNSENSAFAAEAGADIIIVGGAITKALDPGKATSDIRKAIDTRRPVHTEFFKRSSSDQVKDILQKVRSSNVSDGAHRLPCLTDLRPLEYGYKICGPVITVKTVPGDWAKPVEAIDLADKGDIIIIDAGGKPPAIWGELATESAVKKGIAGIIVNGAVRDTADIRKLKFPVWTRHITSHAGDPDGLGSINKPIVISSQRIKPGDWVIADDDGVIVLPKERLIELTNRAADVLESENRIREEIRNSGESLSKVVNLLRWEIKSTDIEIG